MSVVFFLSQDFFGGVHVSTRTLSLEPGQSPGLDESCQTQFCQWRVLKAGMADIEEKPACCCHITSQLCAIEGGSCKRDRFTEKP